MTDISMVKGDSITLDTAVIRLDDDGITEVPVTATKAWFTAKISDRDVDGDSIIALNSQDNEDNVIIAYGNVRVILDPDHTINYGSRWLLYDLQISETDGTITTVERGKIEFKSNITMTID